MTRKLTSSDVRNMFLTFFETKGHTIEPSASLVPVDDPTLLWINSGVATLKKYFDGSVVPDNPRITNAQKSIRTNDIENVGRTARHHTMFEMLGNFSIGDYFKREAIHWAWEFLTDPKWLGLPPEKLYVTVYPKDQEAKRIWHEEVGIPEDHIFEVEDNFWDIGAGPCGPDSEIFYDRGPEFNNLPEGDPELYPGGENERYLEIWNLVFSEFNHMPDGSYEPLPNKNIDTGMGLERIVSILQDAPTNFETDLFLPIIEQTETISHKTYGKQPELDISFKVIADHIRALAFAIGDGALPSNEGRGYVLRRLLRRAVLHGKKLGIERPFLSELVPTVGTIMESYYPEILEQQTFIQKVIHNEEVRFQETLNEGLTLFTKLLNELKEENKSVLSGKDVFQLYDTYGFPLELTEELAEEYGISIDLSGFEQEMEAQRNRARAARQQDQSMTVQSDLLTSITEESHFVGYVDTEWNTTLQYIIAEDALTDMITEGSAQLIFKETPFYSEKGGQVADTGVILDAEGTCVATVTDVQSAPNGQPLHEVTVTGPLMVGNHYTLRVDVMRREKIRRNHTATHLLHQALKEVLGPHAKQAGSLVTPEGLRFDFTHFGAVTEQELKAMERIVNEKIWAAIPVTTLETSLEHAKDLGATALFGEKYGDNVRVVQVSDYSLELCGGIHVDNTAHIGLFTIRQESGIGAGVRRIEALTSEAAFTYLSELKDTLSTLAEQTKSPSLEHVTDKVTQLQQHNHDLQKESEQLLKQIAQQQAKALQNAVKNEGAITYIAEHIQAHDPSQLRLLSDQWKQEALSDILVLVRTEHEKVNLLVAVSEALQQKGVKAGDLIKQLAPYIDGKGGGRPDLAQAGGKNPGGVPQLLKAVTTYVAELS